ncbi:MAG: two-component sensor histidine kinase, partial [Bacteroidetes bacterium]|nr:two-component sensor histidine kinase [Bacteroidota bacterium]
AFQNNEKENRAAELIIANKELAFQNNEKENRAAELILANKELAFQNNEKENRAAELIIANKELAFQNNEKEKRAAELIIANKELAFQNTEKEKRAAELILINQELSFQIQEKEKRETELLRANKELLAFSHISSHDLQEPLRKIQVFSNRILETESKNLSDLGMGDFQRIQASSARMQQSIKDLLIYSRINTTERKFEEIDLDELTDDIKKELHELILSKKVTIHINASIPVYAILVQFRQLLYNLISNALKFSHPHVLPSIHIKTELISSDDTPAGLLPGKEYSRITVEDNGIGFESKFNERIFGMFQKLHGNEKYAGTGIGLAIVKKIIENHNGTITASGELNKGATFEIHIPAG